MDKPHFVIKNRFQKRPSSYAEILTPEILSDVCRRITGTRDYTCEFDDDGYNRGRMAKLFYGGGVFFISFSETEACGRNSYFQSVSSALVRYQRETGWNKKIFYYFLPSTGSIDTAYHRFMYRLMATAGIRFLNADGRLPHAVLPFVSPEDVIAARNENRRRNKSNNSTYITYGPNHVTQLYGKTYGASKYETTLLCLALSQISADRIELYEICEQSLSVLPQACRSAIAVLGKVRVIPTDLTMERNEFETHNSLRSPRYTYNLLQKLGPKKCALCGCEIPELIQGAHIWPVAEIKKRGELSPEEKVRCATDGENGIWLCENHHKLLDEDILSITPEGAVRPRAGLEKPYLDFLRKTTPVTQLAPQVLTAPFRDYLQKRYLASSSGPPAE